MHKYSNSAKIGANAIWGLNKGTGPVSDYVGACSLFSPSNVHVGSSPFYIPSNVYVGVSFLYTPSNVYVST